MRLIVHAGLHKTGSTYLQHILNDHHAALLARGVYYEKQPGYPAHHFAAWKMLRRDFSPIVAMVEAARERGCDTFILSSEDLEGAIFDHVAARGIAEAAFSAGVGEIEWHFCLRDAGEYFASLHAQLQHHVYTDPTAMLFEILREGMMLVMDPLPGQAGTPFWGFCFDPLRYIGAFAAALGHAVYCHDFADASPFPGWGILDSAGALDAITDLPAASARNARLGRDAIEAGYRDRILDLLAEGEEGEVLRRLIEEHVRGNTRLVEPFARLVGARYAESRHSALALFACPAGSQGLRACA